MVTNSTPYLEQFLVAAQGWTDERFLSRADLVALATFSLYLVNLAEADGWQYYGHTYKEGSPMGILVVKADIEGAPYIVFTSGRTYTGCIRAFLHKLEEGWLEWTRDRYRG